MAEVAPEERHHSAHLVGVLRRAGENAVVLPPLVVPDFHRLPDPSQRCLEVARPLDARERGPAIGGTIFGAMQCQDGCLDPSGDVSELVGIAGRVEYARLYGPG